MNKSFIVKITVFIIACLLTLVAGRHTLLHLNAERAYRDGYYHSVWKQLEKTVSYYKKAIAYMPWEGYYRSELVKITNTLLNQATKNEAIELIATLEDHLNVLIELDNLSPWYKNQLGQLYMKKATYFPDDKPALVKKAQKEFELAHQIDNQNPLFSRSLGQFYQLTGQLDAAIPAYQTTLTLDPRPHMFLEVRYNLGVIYLNSNQKQKALNFFEQIYAIKPTYNDVVTLLAKLYYDDQNYKKTAVYLNKSYELNPYNIEKLINIAVFHLQQKNYAQAATFYKRLVNLQPKNNDHQQRYLYCLQQSKTP